MTVRHFLQYRKTLLGAFVFIVMFISNAPTNAAAATRYVSTTGSDSYSCSQALNASTPKKTIGAALACVGPAGSEAGAGNTVQVAAGNYSESLQDVIPSGSSSGAQFTLKCETDFACIITLGDSDLRNQFYFSVPSHWITLRGFTLIGGLAIRFTAYATNPHHDITVINNVIKNAPNATGIDASGIDRLNIIGNFIHDIGSVCTGQGPGYCHGIYATNDTNYWIIERNEIYNTTAYGVHLYADPGRKYPSHFIIRDNKLHNAGTPGRNGAGLIVYGDNHLIYNNLSYNNVYDGILLRGVTDPLVYNNTLYGNGEYGISQEYGSGVACKNNLAVGNGSAGISGCDTKSNNITSGSASSFFVNPGVNFALLAGSTAINAGVNLSPTITDDFAGAARPQSGAYDVGAYEYGTSAASNPPSAPKGLKVLP